MKQQGRYALWKGRIRWFSAEFFVVVAGILFAFTINTWWQDAQTSQREADYLIDLARDFEENADRLELAISDANEVMVSAQILLKLEDAQAGRALGIDSLNYLLQTLSILPTFQPVTRTYDNILGAGELQTISNPEIRMILADFESQLLLVSTVEETQERQYVALFVPYIMNHLDYLPVAMFSSEAVELPDARYAETIYPLLGTREFQNWAILRLTWADDLQSVHKSVLELVKEVQVALSK